MTQSYVERELKFDVEPGFAVPDVTSLLPAGGRAQQSTEQLRSEYFDTADYALLRARMVLRHRTGTTDTGWQLKVPDGAFREEIRVDDSDSPGVPDELHALLTGVRHGAPLRPVATISTQRSVTRLIGKGGQVLAEVDDDTVQAAATGDAATISTWREVEVELGEAGLKTLHSLGKQLRRAGARPSRSPSKLSRALSSELARRSAPRGDAGQVIGAYLEQQHQVILAGDLALRRGNDLAVHKTRVATRRFRSTLRVFGDFFDPARSAALDRELQWYAGLLGEVRDRQVLHKRLDTMLGHVDDVLLLGPVRERVDSELSRQQAERWQHLLTELDGERYLAVLANLNDWAQRPPRTPVAAGAAGAVLTPARRARRTVTKRLKAASASEDTTQLHRARKAAKRARYAAEAARPVTGKRAATRHVRRYQDLQDLLGEHQDSIVSAAEIRRLGAVAGTAPGENGFAYGILYEREEHAALAARHAAQAQLKRWV